MGKNGVNVKLTTYVKPAPVVATPVSMETLFKGPKSYFNTVNRKW